MRPTVLRALCLALGLLFVAPALGYNPEIATFVLHEARGAWWIEAHVHQVAFDRALTAADPAYEARHASTSERKRRRRRLPQAACHGPRDRDGHAVGTPFSLEAGTQLLHFWKAWRNNGRAQIIDPYAAIGTPPLPASMVPTP